MSSHFIDLHLHVWTKWDDKYKDKLEGYHFKKAQYHRDALFLRPQGGLANGRTSYSKVSNEIFVDYQFSIRQNMSTLQMC